MSDCLFCRIIRKEIPAKIEYQNDEVTVIHDINPQAPVHVLILPNKHIARVDEAQAGDALLLGRLLLTAKETAQRLGVSDFRLAVNNGEGASQTVFHIHIHLLAGRRFGWPPG